MFEWELIVERIQSLIQAEEAAAERRPERPDEQAGKLFQARMGTLGSHLEQFYDILTHVDSYAMEELADAFCRAAGRPPGYHRFVHDEPREMEDTEGAHAEE
jgi:hypothetical protein